MLTLVQSWVAFFPLMLGVLYGISYALNGYIYRQAPLSYCLALQIAFSFVLWMSYSLYNGTFRAANIAKVDPHVVGLILLNACIIFICWWLAGHTAKTISPTYMAAGEVSYVLFTPLMAWLIFGRNELNTHTIIAGLLILTGCAVLIYGQSKGATNAIV